MIDTREMAWLDVTVRYWMMRARKAKHEQRRHAMLECLRDAWSAHARRRRLQGQ